MQTLEQLASNEQTQSLTASALYRAPDRKLKFSGFLNNHDSLP